MLIRCVESSEVAYVTEREVHCVVTRPFPDSRYCIEISTTDLALSLAQQDRLYHENDHSPQDVMYHQWHRGGPV
jgi:hypothetical protein